MEKDTFGVGVLCRHGRKNAKKIQKYIKNQWKEDDTADQVSKKFIDPFRNPSTKARNKAL